jgi:hypothetical protein
MMLLVFRKQGMRVSLRRQKANGISHTFVDDHFQKHDDVISEGKQRFRKWSGETMVGYTLLVEEIHQKKTSIPLHLHLIRGRN